MRKNGQITIVLSLVLTTMISLVLTLVEGARINAIRMQIEIVTDMGLDSVFAEYNRELLNEFQLFFIDTTYGQSIPSLNQTTAHLTEYMNYNFNSDKGYEDLISKDFLKLKVTDVEILMAAVASDEGGLVLKNQAIDYMEDKIGLSYFSIVMEQLQTVNDHQLVKLEASESQVKMHDKMQEVLKTFTDEDWESIKIDQPVDENEGVKVNGILPIVVEDTNSLSKKAICQENYASERLLTQGTGLCGRENITEGLLKELLFGEYILENCTNYCEDENVENSTEIKTLQYQQEYILVGKESDVENLEGTVNRILVMRELSNLIHIYQDSSKIAQADTLAATISALLMIPETQQIFKHMILFAWSYAESVNDIKILLEKGRVPLLKSESDWQLDIDSVLNNKNNSMHNKTSEEGLLYEDYIRILMALTDKGDKVMRLMDIIEMTLRDTKGNEFFRMDGCLDYLEARITVESEFGYSFTIQRKYFY